MSAAEDSFRTLQTAIAGVIASACADPNDGIAWAAERDVHMLTASQIIDDFLDPEVDAAEGRGAVKALRKFGHGCCNHDWSWISAQANRIESGEVTL